MPHTPGPWNYDWVEWGIRHLNRNCSGALPDHLYDCENHPQREEADYRLIAAAPELLQALIMVRDADEDCKRDKLPTIPPTARARIDAAIAKATTPAT